MVARAAAKGSSVMDFDMRHIADTDLALIDVDRARQVYQDWQHPAKVNSLTPWEGEIPPLSI